MQEHNINLRQLQIEEHYQYMRTYGDLVQEFGAEELKVEEEMVRFAAAFDDEDTALKKITKSALTEPIAEADRARCTTLRGLNHAVRGGLDHFDPLVRAASQQLQILLHTYGNILRKSATKRSAALSNLLNDMRDNYATQVEAAGFEGWVTTLHAQNNEFLRLTKERFDEVAARPKIVLKEARRALDAVYLEMIERLRALRIVDKTNAIFGEFFDRLDVVITKFNADIAHRAGIRSKKGDTAEAVPANE